MCARTVRILLSFAAPLVLFAQSPVDPPDPVDPIAPVIVPADAPTLTHDRIFGIIPNFQTVNDPTKPYVPLQVREKWLLFVRETIDPYTFASAAAGAGISQWHNDDPKYGVGFKPYMQRFGAAYADVATQNFFSDAVLASFFHEDPRYFRKGPGSPVVHRILYAMSRVVITRRDSGKDAFNFSGILGMGMGIALSNAYYPPASINGPEMGSRVGTSLISSALGNLLPEFWPDFKAKLARYRHL
jgi:hypothetical protein